MKIKSLIVLILSGLLLTACSHIPPVTTDTTEQSTTEEEVAVQEEPTESVMEEKTQVTVTASSEGFSPASVTVKKGEAVVFANESDAEVWVASAFHQTHDVYPEFDELEGMSKGESWSFTFDKVGAWKYHNHLNPTQFGEVVVTE